MYLLLSLSPLLSLPPSLLVIDNCTTTTLGVIITGSEIRVYWNSKIKDYDILGKERVENKFTDLKIV